MLLLVSVASAGELTVWEREEFGAEGPLAGTDDWENGFADDRWRSSGDRAYTQSDLNVGRSEDGYGSGWAADNWLLRGVDIGQGGIEATFDTQDDDTMGVVLAHDGASSFYLAGLTNNDGPPPVGLVTSPTLFLLKVNAGEAFLVGEWTGTPGAGEHTLRLERDDSRVWVSLDGLLLIQTEDPDPLPAGRAGLYAYDAGEDFPQFAWDEDTPAWFERVRAYAWDEDGDGVYDDVDLCETVADPDQADLDGDGIGDLCDEDPGELPGTTTDPGEEPPATEPGDGDPEDLTPVVDDPAGREGLRAVSGCATAGSAPWWLGLLLLRRGRRARRP